MDKNLIQIIFELLPGFFAAWVFYGLTCHPKRDIYDRIIQALIFTAIVKVFVSMFARACLWLGHYVSLGKWTTSVELGWSMVFALIFGVLISALANRDIVHCLLREGPWIKRLRITTKHSYPSEWFSAFQREGNRFVLLHMKDGKRFYGYPEEWPNDPTGHFLLVDCSTLDAENVEFPLSDVRRMIVPATEVIRVEQSKTLKERQASAPVIPRTPEPKPPEDNRKELPTNGRSEHAEVTDGAAMD